MNHVILTGGLKLIAQMNWPSIVNSWRFDQLSSYADVRQGSVGLSVVAAERNLIAQQGRTLRNVLNCFYSLSYVFRYFRCVLDDTKNLFESLNVRLRAFAWDAQID